MKKYKAGEIITPKNFTKLPILKPYEEGKDDPQHVIGQAYRSCFYPHNLQVTDMQSGITFIIVEE